MRALFSTAASTIAWLGESDGNSDLVYYAILLSAPRQSLGLNNFGTRRALRDLLNRKYWSRVWVIQEFLLPVKLDVWWGRCRVKASDLHQLVWAMTGFSSRSKPQDYHVWNTPGRVLLLYRTNYQTMCRFEKHDYCKEFADAMTLQSLLRSFSSSQCTLIHDRVYALLGIASDVIYSSDPISPDYTKSPTELSMDVLRSQYGNQIPGVKRAWISIELLCSVLGLTRREIEQSAFVRARKIERETRALDLSHHSALCFDWVSPVPLPEISTPRSKHHFYNIVRLMEREPGCLTALQDYLDYSKQRKPLGQRPKWESISMLLGKDMSTVGRADIRPWTNMSGLTMVPFDDHREKCATDQSYDYLTESICEQFYNSTWIPFFETTVMGFMRRAINRPCDTGHGPCKSHCPIVASYRWFGRYGSAIVWECPGNPVHEVDASCDTSLQDWCVTGTAFICKWEADRSHH